MARKYAINQSDTNTASTTMIGFTATAAVRPLLYDVIISSVATPADNAGEYHLKRHTAAGTSTAITPQALDSGDPASTSTAGGNHTVEPTYSGIPMLDIAVNQRATFRWVAAPGGEIKCPATAANGVSLLANAVGGSAVACLFTFHFEE